LLRLRSTARMRAALYLRRLDRMPAGAVTRTPWRAMKALELRKDFADAPFDQALALLTIGAFRRGFEKYERGWRRSGMPPLARGYGRPLWLGEYPLETTHDHAVRRPGR